MADKETRHYLRRAAQGRSSQSASRRPYAMRPIPNPLHHPPIPPMQRALNHARDAA